MSTVKAPTFNNLSAPILNSQFLTISMAAASKLSTTPLSCADFENCVTKVQHGTKKIKENKSQ